MNVNKKLALIVEELQIFIKYSNEDEQLGAMMRWAKDIKNNDDVHSMVRLAVYTFLLSEEVQDEEG